MPSPGGAGDGAYGTGQILLHWIVAAALPVQVLLGLTVAALFAPDAVAGATGSLGPRFALPTILHASLGTIVLTLVLWRIALRAERWPRPRLPRVRLLAHGGLYAALLAVPVTGAGAWLLPAPAATTAHRASLVLLAVAIGLHVAHVLLRGLVLRDGTLRRMLPRR